MRAALLSVVVVTALVAACPKEGGPAPSEGIGPTSQPAAPDEGKKGEHHGAEKTGLKIDREQVDGDGVVRRGAKLSDLAALTVAEATARPDIDGKLVKLTGKVESVCQPMGCWMVIAGDKPNERVRITSKSHDIFVPKSAAGRMATVEGEFKLKTIPMATAQHYEDERELKAGEAKKVFTEDQKEFSVSVVALELKPAA
ncbi:MAG: DUF4920 domain-containing protein [Deltaproteobacteria bacterium]|nr:DUF4920 domain-containing protein [Deltaproteobacteria bacterium]